MHGAPAAQRLGWQGSGAGWQSRMDSRVAVARRPPARCEGYIYSWHPFLFFIQMPDNSTLTGRKGWFWLTVREVQSVAVRRAVVLEAHDWLFTFTGSGLQLAFSCSCLLSPGPFLVE